MLAKYRSVYCLLSHCVRRMYIAFYSQLQSNNVNDLYANIVLDSGTIQLYTRIIALFYMQDNYVIFGHSTKLSKAENIANFICSTSPLCVMFVVLG